MKFILLLLFALSIPCTASAETVDIVRHGYFKQNRNRIMTYEFSGLPTWETMKETISNSANLPPETENRLYVVYFYPKGSNIPGDIITNQQSFAAVNAILYDNNEYDRWEFAYMRSPNGQRTLVNCMETNSDLCK